MSILAIEEGQSQAICLEVDQVRRYLYPLVIILSLLSAKQVPAQSIRSQGAVLERMIVVVPMVGAGTADDPRRPMGMPAGDAKPDSPIGYRYVISDSGQLAIVELTAPSRKHFDTALTAYGASAQAFDPLLHDRATVEKALRLIRRDFDLDSFLGVIHLPGGVK